MTQYLVHEDSYTGRGGRVTMLCVVRGGVPWLPHHGPAVWVKGGAFPESLPAKASALPWLPPRSLPPPPRI